MKDSKKEGWVVCECEYEYEHDVKESPSPVPNAPPPRKAPKAVDEDLYNIFPDLLYANSKRVCFSSALSFVSKIKSLKSLFCLFRKV